MINEAEIKNTIEYEEDLQKLIDMTIFLTIPTVELLMRVKKGGDALLLYMFYYKSAKIQKTNQPWVTNNFCMKGLKWNKTRLVRAKKILRDNNLVEAVALKDGKGIYQKHFIKIKYKWSQNKESKLLKHLGTQNGTSGFLKLTEPQDNTLSSGTVSHPLDNRTTNAYSVLNSKCLQREKLSLKNKNKREEPHVVSGKDTTPDTPQVCAAPPNKRLGNFGPLTYRQVWQVAVDYNVRREAVKIQYRDILRKLDSGELKTARFYNKQNTDQLLRAFVNNSLRYGTISTCDDSDRKFLITEQNPKKEVDSLIRSYSLTFREERDQLLSYQGKKSKDDPKVIEAYEKAVKAQKRFLELERDGEKALRI